MATDSRAIGGARESEGNPKFLARTGDPRCINVSSGSVHTVGWHIDRYEVRTRVERRRARCERKRKGKRAALRDRARGTRRDWDRRRPTDRGKKERERGWPERDGSGQRNGPVRVVEEEGCGAGVSRRRRKGLETHRAEGEGNERRREKERRA